MPDEKCIICSYGKVKHLFSKHTESGVYGIKKCDACKSAFVDPRPSQKDMNGYYKSKNYNDFSYEQALKVHEEKMEVM